MYTNKIRAISLKQNRYRQIDEKLSEVCNPKVANDTEVRIVILISVFNGIGWTNGEHERYSLLVVLPGAGNDFRIIKKTSRTGITFFDVFYIKRIITRLLNFTSYR